MDFKLPFLALLLAAAPARADSAEDAALAAQHAAEAAAQAAEAAKQAAQAVEALAQHVAAKEQVAPTKAPDLPPWAWQLGLSLLSTTGNADAFAAQLNAGVDGHWHDWGTEFRLNGAFGQTNPRDNQPQETTAQNAALTAKGSHAFTPIFGTYVYSGLATDRVASITYQVFGELGVSVLWWEILHDDYVHSMFRSSVGFRGMYEAHHQYFPAGGDLDATTIYGPTMTINWRYALTKVTVFSEDAEILEDIRNTRDVRVTSNTALTVQLKEGLAMQTAFKVRHIGAPQPGKKSTDTQLSAGVNWTW